MNTTPNTEIEVEVIYQQIFKPLECNDNNKKDEYMYLENIQEFLCNELESSSTNEPTGGGNFKQHLLASGERPCGIKEEEEEGKSLEVVVAAKELGQESVG